MLLNLYPHSPKALDLSKRCFIVALPLRCSSQCDKINSRFGVAIGCLKGNTPNVPLIPSQLSCNRKRAFTFEVPFCPITTFLVFSGTEISAVNVTGIPHFLELW